MTLPAKNWRETATNLVPGWLRGHYGTRLVGLIALYADLISQGASEALRATWLRESTSPDDILPFVGADSNMPRYPVETLAQYRTRLVGNADGTGGRWDAWKYAGTTGGLATQLHALGYPSAVILPARDTLLTTVPSWSRFIVVVPFSELGVHLADASDVWSDTPPDEDRWDKVPDLWDLVEDIPGQIQALRGLIHNFKAAHEVCESVISIVSGQVWDYPPEAVWDGPDSGNWDDPPNVVITIPAIL